MAKRGRKFERVGKQRIDEMDADALQGALQECLGKLKDSEDRAKREALGAALTVVRQAVVERWPISVAEQKMREALS